MEEREARLLIIITGIWMLCSGCISSPAEHGKPAIHLRGYEPVPFGPELQEALENVLLQIQDHPYVGISAAVIVPGYEPWSGASGESHAGEPATSEMLFDIGSIVKSFEAAYTLRLAENDRIDLDDPVSAYLPPHSGLDGSISIRQLLNHTSGLFNVFEHPDFPWVDPEVEYSRWWDWEDVLDTFVSDPYGSPGAVQHYSSTNYLLLTVILDELTGESAATGIEQVFLTPMGLEDTFISMGEPPGPDFVVAHPWVDQDQDGTMEDLYGIPLTWKVSLSHPVAFSTALDMANWMYALYHQKSVLNPYSLSQMLTFPEVIDDEQDSRRYGLGVVDYSDLVEVGAIGHTGSSLGYSAAALYLPDYGVTVAWLINRGESPAEWAGWLMNRIWWALFEVIDENLLPLHKH